MLSEYARGCTECLCARVRAFVFAFAFVRVCARACVAFARMSGMRLCTCLGACVLVRVCACAGAFVCQRVLGSVCVLGCGACLVVRVRAGVHTHGMRVGVCARARVRVHACASVSVRIDVCTRSRARVWFGVCWAWLGVVGRGRARRTFGLPWPPGAFPSSGAPWDKSALEEQGWVGYSRVAAGLLCFTTVWLLGVVGCVCP